MKRKMDGDLFNSVKRLKQSEMSSMDNNKDNMASSSGGEGVATVTDMIVPTLIKLLLSNLSNNIQLSYDKLSKRLDSSEGDLQGKLKELVSVAINVEVDKLWKEYSAEIDSLKAKVASLEKSYADLVKDNGMSSAAAFEQRKKGIVVRGLPVIGTRLYRLRMTM